MNSSIERSEEHGAYVVRRPRSTDAIGHTLCLAFVNEAELPADMQRAIDAMDRFERR